MIINLCQGNTLFFVFVWQRPFRPPPKEKAFLSNVPHSLLLRLTWACNERERGITEKENRISLCFLAGSGQLAASWMLSIRTRGSPLSPSHPFSCREHWFPQGVNMRCIGFFGSWFVVDLIFTYLDFSFSFFFFWVLFTVFRTKAFLWRPGPSAKTWLFFEYIIVRKCFVKILMMISEINF